MTYTVYGDAGSGSCIVEAALAEIGARYRICEVDLGRAAQREDPYAALNPHRKLPTLLTPEGETLTESVAIALTLDERHPDAGLLPAAGSAERAVALRWLLYTATELYPVVEINDYPERFAPDTATVPKVREIARQHWRRRLLVLEAAISGDPWLLGARFCLTDIYVAVVSRWAQQTEWRPGHVPRIEALAGAVAQRPAIAPVWLRHFGSPAQRPAAAEAPPS